MSDDFPITIFHNPDCSTSRNALKMIRAAGHTPTIVDYRTVGWTRTGLASLLERMGVRPRAVLRERGTPAAEQGLLDPAIADDVLLDAMVRQPLLVNRPIVVTPRGAKLCRPFESVLELLDRQPASATPKDGEGPHPAG